MKHVFLEALLFPSAGSVICAMSNEQDKQKMVCGGGLTVSFNLCHDPREQLISYWISFYTWIYSKDVILGVSCTKHQCVAGLSFKLIEQ